MRFQTRTWVILSLLCFAGAGIFWQLSARLERRAALEAASHPTNGPVGNISPSTAQPVSNVPPAISNAVPPGAVGKTNAAGTALLDPFAHRLSNTRLTLDELIHSDHALLLRNALIDSTAGIPLVIPAELRARGDAGAYVVQARGPITDAFRAALRNAGAEIVAYVPNNAFLVRASAPAAEQLKASPEMQAVLAWEPYFKLDPALLDLALAGKLLPAGALNILLFPGERAAAQADFDRLGVAVTSEEPSPFGPHLTVITPVDKLADLARLPAVQDIERYFPRAKANDLTRARLRVSTNTSTAANYLNLSGANVLVAVNDTGVDANHPDLAGRVSGATRDIVGHGTHVAGIIASSGANGPPGTNVVGSVSNANFRGMAPAALLFSQGIDTYFGPPATDTSLLEAAALTNAIINNNSWSYIGESDYNLASAIWDAGARDALPGVPGSQPLTLVFAAGNGNPVETEFFGGFPGFITSPGTAKNVITVGASENRRSITNEVSFDGEFSFPVWLGLTDSSNQVASLSARGNVGVGREGPSGRFKPDVVAPGTFIVSCRSTDPQYREPEVFNSLSVLDLPNQVVAPHATNVSPIFVPPEGVAVFVQTLSNRFSPSPFFLQIHIRDGAVPGPADFVGYNFGGRAVTGGTTYYSIGNTENFPVSYDLRVIIVLTNDTGNYFSVLSNLNSRLGLYRYESGTSQAAAGVSGVLALMQEYFATRLARTNSPALMKALLINGARSLGGAGALDYQISGGANGQGWGLVNITNSAPVVNAVDGARGAVAGSLVFYEQDPARALQTGQSATRTVSVTGAATNFPLRITLVWTDPPGNPAVGPKLVNDLDLIVTNLANGQVFIGNNISGTFNVPVSTNDLLALDQVNNVENVFIDRRLSGSYSVTVRAHRVNVNAVTAQTNGIAQDYALVISSGSPSATALAAADSSSGYDPAPFVSTVTNGIPLLHQRVGANSPFLISTNGVTNQWRFFVVTNELPLVADTNGVLMPQTGTASNIAFLVFLAPNLSWPRTNNADLDLYVSANPAITNLDQTAIATSFRSLTRGGTESVVLSNVIPGTVYYAGVKSEDQAAGEFGFFSVSSSSPFSSMDTNGNIVAQGYVLPAEIPDGAPDSPQAALVFAFVTEPAVVQNVVVTNAVTHGNLGDLIGVLEHNQKFSTLNNGQGNPPNYTGSIQWVFDDSDSGQIVNATFTDPPGTLRNFVGEEGSGVWQMSMIDSSQFYTGRVDNLVISIEPRSDDLTNGNGIIRTILPNRFFYTVIDVPNDATNLQVCAAPDFGPVEIYVKRGGFPDRQTYDAFAFVAPPGGCLELTKRDSPPLSAGRYFIGIFNPNSTPITTRIKVTIGRDLQKASAFAFRSGGSQNLLDDATTNAVAHVFRNQLVADVRVGVRIDHPRTADLVLHLVSPSGTRVALAENRGGPDGANFGFGTPALTIVPISSIGGPAQTNIDLNLSGPDGTLEVDYDFFSLPDRMTVYYENELLFDSGFVSGGGTFAVDFSGSATNLTIIMNEGGFSSLGTLWTITAKILTGVTYANFTDNATLARLPIKFEPPPFTNINYNVTNYFTNATLVNSGFEDGVSFPEFLYSPVGQLVTGWLLTSGEVNTMGVGATNAPWYTAPYEGQRFLDINGNTEGGIIQTNFATVAGREYRVTYAYAYNPAGPTNATAEVRVINPLMVPIRTVSVSPPTNAAGVWMTNIFNFTADSSSTLLEVASLTPGRAGVFFDAFLVEQVTTVIQTGIYYQPEEPLSIFRGENAFGDWRLEIWDSRAGAALTNSVLLAWRLNITFVNTNPPVIALSNGVAYCGTIGTNEAAFFVINTPLSASISTNFLTASAGVDLVFNPFGVPLVSPGDTNFLSNEMDGFAVLATNGWNSFTTNGGLLGLGPQQIQPGHRYYLAVRNRSDSDPVDFCLTVSFDRIDADLLNVRTVTNPCVTATISSTNLFDYYQVDIASNVLELSFQLSMLSADLGLVVKPGFPLPNYNFYYRRSDNPGLADEFIEVTDFTGMVLPGRWYIGVYNANQADATYQLCVSQITGTVIPLGTGGQYTNSLAPGNIDYYKVNILSNSCLASFCAYSTNADLDIYVALDRLLPVNRTPTNTSLVSSNIGIPSAECITLSAFTATNQLTNGCWIMAVVNRGPATASYYVDVTQQTDCFAYTELTNCLPFTNTIASAGGADVYQFYVSNSAVQATFEVFGMNTNVDLFIRYGAPVPPPSPAAFTYASTNLDLTNDFRVVVTNYPTVLTPGWWFLSVVNRTGSTNATYGVRACQIQTNDVRRLAEGTVCNILPPLDLDMPNSGVHFYRFNVATGAVQVTFELYNLTNNVDLFVQRSPPLTNFTTFYGDASGLPVWSTNLGATNEFICFATNSASLRLAPGPWFVTVVNRDTNPAPYCLRTVQLGTNSFTRLINAQTICDDGLPLLDDTGTNGIRYFIFHAETNAVAVNFEAFNIFGGDVDIFVQKDLCLPNFTTFNPASTNYPYYSANPGTNAEWICVATNSTPVALSGGDWFIAVVNRTTNTDAQRVSYCVRATEIFDTNIVRLTDGVAFCTNQIGSIGFITDYYVFNVSNAAVQAVFETLRQSSTNLNIFVNYGPCFPNLATVAGGPGSYPYPGQHLSNTTEYVCVATNSSPVPLTNGDWFVAVRRQGFLEDYCIRATQLLSNNIIQLVNGERACYTVGTTNGPGYAGVQFHAFHVSSNAVMATFEVTSTNGNVDAYLQYGLCTTNLPSYRGAVTNYPYVSTNLFTNASLSFYPYASTNLGTNTELICVVTNSLPVPLRGGDWFLAIVNRETNSRPVEYCVRAFEVRSDEITELVSRTPVSGIALETTNGSAGIGIDYYHYYVATNAIQINIDLFGIFGGNVDIYAQRGPCWTDPANFTYVSSNLGTTNDCLFIATNSAPVPLAPGDWYFAVVNHNPLPFPAGYSIRLIEFLDRDVTPLANCVPVVNTVPLTNYINGAGIDYYVLDVPASAVETRFEIVPLPNPSNIVHDVNAYLRRELVLPRNNFADYYGTNTGTVPEYFVISSNSAPRALAPGRWFLAVENTTLLTNFGAGAILSARATYSVRVVQTTTNDITRLTNGRPFSHTVGAAPAACNPVDYYVFNVSPNAVQAVFKTFAANGNVDLFLRHAPLPSSTNFARASTNAGPADEFISISTNDSPIFLTSGDWYLAVVNREATPVTYTVCATQYIIDGAGAGDIIRLTNGLAYSNLVATSTSLASDGRQHYVFTVSNNAVQANFETFAANGNVDLFIRRGVPLPTELSFDASSVNLGITNELIILVTNAATMPVLTPGDWYVTVVNRGATAVSYSVRATQFIIGPIGTADANVIRLANTVCISNNIAGAAPPDDPRLQYYVFSVSPTSVRAHFEILSPSGNVDLIARRGLPLPTLTNYDGISARPGTCEELITLFTNGTAPLQLTPGDWYVAVVNTNPTPVSYMVCASQYTSSGMNISLASPSITSTQLCLTWTNVLPGVSYHVQAKPNLSVSNWTAISPTLRATNNSVRWCVDLPSNWHFFRIKEGLAPKPGLFPVLITARPSCGAVLTWMASTNQQFVVDWSSTLSADSWRSFANPVSSINTTFTFTDDCSETGGPAPFRFYRVLLIDR
ncbi:MAG: hypothetical protein QOF48_3248 [Verrucomicrobiota bacterium]|jgi:subtilisin-like proprotein convertase family protein